MSSLFRTRNSGGGRRSQFGDISLGRRPGVDVPVPTHFRCPIFLDLMKDPVTLSTGITYDRQSIETWLDTGNLVCPVTNQAVTGEDLIPNHAIRRMIQDWCVANRSFGVERIPTPRIPATPAQVLGILTDIDSAGRRGDYVRCGELVGMIKALGKESERNRRCVVSNGVTHALSSVFEAIAKSSSQRSTTTAVLEEILSALTGYLPLDEVACRYLASPDSLRSIVSILTSGDLAGRLNAVMVVKEIVHSDKDLINGVAKTQGLIESLVKLIKEPILPQATKASLVATFYLVLSDAKIASMFVELGLVDLLLEILVDSEKSMCEKALGVLDGICNSPAGREKAYDHALTVPVLVKKMFRVSDMATEFSVSILWKLAKNYRKEKEILGGGGGGGGGTTACIVEALQVGAFQKLLLLLQIGCSDSTKEKATDLLKMLNSSRGSLECIESVDFKELKRPF